ncbi:MAG: lycopene cyclase family protein [Tomitella sp.]|nr:lycopene cyclase family protein [Tomitella sp.]
MFDIIAVGAGPAGRALAHRCLADGLRVAVVDPRHDAAWRPTYGAWADELPWWLPDSVVAARVHAPAVHTGTVRHIDRTYVVFDNGRLQEALRIDAATAFRSRAQVLARRSVTLSDGTVISARAVIDARGLPRGRGRPEQTAFGVIVDSDRARSVLDGQTAWFMDWRRDNGAALGAPRTFLYAVPIGDGRYLLEETCLAGEPALPIGELRTRLCTRLQNRGLGLTGDEPVERVRFALRAGPSLSGGHSTGTPVDAYGSRGGLMHPATGYSVGAALTNADTMAAAAAAGRGTSDALWGAGPTAVHRLRSRGLDALLTLTPQQAVGFFDAFFRLPARHQRAYLSDRRHPRAVAAAMGAVFVQLPPRTKARVLRATLRW